MINETKTENEFEIGAAVLMAGRVIGRSEFRTGPPAFYVEFVRKGKPEREWFLADDLEEDGDTD